MPHLPDILTSAQLASFYLPLEHESRLTKFAFTFWLFTFAPIYHQMQKRKMEHSGCQEEEGSRGRQDEASCLKG